MYNFAFLIVLLPFFGAMASFLAEVPRRVAQICVAFSFASAAMAVFLLVWRLAHPRDTDMVNVFTFFAFAPQGGANATLDSPTLQHFQPQFGVHVDPLALALMVVVAVTGFVVQWHATTSIRSDPDARRIFWLTSCLIAAVLGVVVSDGLFQFLLLSGAAGGLLWLLDMHWWNETVSATQARRAFFMNRIADAALLLATIYVYVKFAPTAEALPPATTLPISDPLSFALIANQSNLAVQGGVPGIGMHGLIVLAVLIAIAAGARLALFPFHLATLDTDQAPLPALALGAVLPAICGAVLIARMFPLFLDAQYVLGALAIVGGATALGAACMALVHRDMARVVLTLAVAQLGLVAVGFGSGGFSAPLQMCATYMAATVLLFLVCNNFARAFRTRDIAEMGGAWRSMRMSSLLLGAWVAAVAGLDLVGYNALATVIRNTGPSDSGRAVAPAVAAIAGVLAAAAMLVTVVAAARLWMMVCSGSALKRRGFNADRVVDGPAALLRSTAAALLGLIVIVVLGIPTVRWTFSHFVFYGSVAHQNLDIQPWAIGLALAVGVVGVVGGALLGGRERRAPAATGRAGNVLTRLSLQTLVPHVAGRVAVRSGELVVRTDYDFIDPLLSGLTEGVTVVELMGERARSPRLTAYLTGALAFASLVVLTAGLFATDHLPRLAL